MNKNNKKIILISNMYPSKEHPNYGIFVKNFEDVLNKEDFVINKKVLTKKNSTIAKLLSYVQLFLRMIPLYVASKKEIIYVHFPLYFAPVLLPLAFLNKNLVINFHGSDAIFDSTIKRILFLFLSPVVKRAKIVVPSKYYKSLIANVFKIKDSSILVSPSGGVNQKLFFPMEKKDHGFTLGFISNFIKEKGWNVFLEALKIIKDQNPEINYKAFMVGSGPDTNEITKTIQQLDINVTIQPPVKQKELCEMYNKMDVFIFPTYRESLGLVGIEAMMCGIPVIASKVGGPMGYMEEGHNGYLFNIKNSDQLASKIITFYGLNSSEREKMKSNCISTAKRYDANLVKKELLNFLNEI